MCKKGKNENTLIAKVFYDIMKKVLMMKGKKYEQIFQNDASLSLTVGILVGMF